MFDTLNGAQLAAKRLKASLSISSSQARELTARAAGYQDWHQLTQIIGTASAPNGAEGAEELFLAFVDKHGIAKSQTFAEILAMIEPKLPIYFTNDRMRDVDDIPLKDIRDEIREDLLLLTAAARNSTIIPDEVEEDEEEDLYDDDRKNRVLQLRRYDASSIAGKIRQFSPTGHIMVISEEDCAVVWNLIPEEQTTRPIAFSMVGNPEKLQDPENAIRLYDRIADNIQLHIPEDAEKTYNEAVQRAAEIAKPHLEAGISYTVHLNKGRISISRASLNDILSHNAISEYLMFKENSAEQILVDLPRVYQVEPMFTDRYSSTVYYFGGEERVHPMARGYSVDNYQVSIKIVGTRTGDLSPDAPIKSLWDSRHKLDVDIGLSSVRITPLNGPDHFLPGNLIPDPDQPGSFMLPEPTDH